MTREELHIMGRSLYRPFHLSDEEKIIWETAFEIYNQNNEKKLEMNCAPCYMKVLMFIRFKLREPS